MKGKRFTRKVWKRFVRILSCLVVFCTTYALILPAITAQATSYCGQEEHTHSDECYSEHLECELDENEETGHVHSEECYSRKLTCDKTPHQHTRICFSNPEADLETAEDWEKTLPKEEELADKTAREKIIAVAKSQLNTKESEDNFEVDSETEVRGITRYGQWDGEPYEEWSGAFARFVLSYAGADEDKEEADKFINVDKDIDQWIEKLQENEQLLPIDEGKPGDILYIYDEDDDNRLKAGIITEVKDETIKAIIGNRNNKVDTQQIKLDDKDVRAIYKAVADDEIAGDIPAESTDELVENNNGEDEEFSPDKSSKDSVSDADKDPTSDNEVEREIESSVKNNGVGGATDTGESDPDSLEKPSEENHDFDSQFIKTIDVSDGSKITASWDKDTFESEDVTFLAEKVTLSDEEKSQIENKIGDITGKNIYSFDLSFYRPNATGDSLQKVEPKNKVMVEISLPEGAMNEEIANESKVLHFKENGKLEDLSNQASVKQDDDLTKIKNPESDNRGAALEFECSSFSVYAIITEANNDYVRYLNQNDPYDIAWGSTTVLNRNYDDVKSIVFTANCGTTIIDLHGHYIKGNGPLFTVPAGCNLKIIDSATHSEYKNVSDNLGANGNSIVYSNKNSSYRYNRDQSNASPYFDQKKTKIDNIGVIMCHSGNAVQVTGGTIEFENIAISSQGLGISANNSSKVYLDNCYLIQGQRGLLIEGGAEGHVSGGAIADHGSVSLPGAGIYVGGTNTKLTLENGAQVVNNISMNDKVRVNGGGGIHVNAGTLTLNEVYVNANKADSTTGEGSWATGGGIKVTNGGKLYMEHKNSTVEGNYSYHSGGGISLSDANTILYMSNGKINGNIAHRNEGGGLALQAKDSTYSYDGYATAVLYAGEIKDNDSLTGKDWRKQWGGGGIFVGHTAKLIMPYGVDVYSNIADVYGGGIAGCSTGKIIVDESVTNLNNTANGNDRWTEGEKTYDGPYSKAIGLTTDRAKDYFTCFYASVAGNFQTEGAKWYGNVDGELVSDVKDGRLTSQYCMGLTAINKTAPLDKELIVTNNYSYMHGGGILVNGYMLGGRVEYIYNSDTLNMDALKQVRVKNTNELQNDASGYQFILSDSNNRIVSRAVSDANGSFNLSNVTAESSEAGNSTIRYFLTEVGQTSAGVEFDNSRYRVDITVSTKAEPEWSYTYYDQKEKRDIEVIVKEFTTSITNVEVFKKDNPQSSDNESSWSKVSVNSKHSTPSELTNRQIWEVHISPESAIFTNYLVKKSVMVKKVWDDKGQSISHDGQDIKVDLYQDLKANHRSKPIKHETVILNSENNWTKQWNDLDSVNSAGQEYEYWVEEVTQIPGYISKTESSVKDVNETVKIPVYTEAWIKADTIVEGNQYILYDENSGNSLSKHSKPSDNKYWVTSSDTSKLSGPVNNLQGISAYSETNNSEILTAEAVSGKNGLMMKSSGSWYLVANGEDNQWNRGLQFLPNYGKLHGFVMGDKLQIYGWDEYLGPSYVTYLNNTFGTSQRNDGSTVSYPIFYTKATVQTGTREETLTTSTNLFTITNTRITNKLKVIKTDDNDKPLPGAVFKLYKGTAEMSENLVATLTSNENGIIEFANLEKGQYLLVETKAPDGYQIGEKDTWQIEFTNIHPNDETVELDTEEQTLKVKNLLLYFELPETGGPGTNIITASGAAFIVLASCMYRSSRKRNRKEGE